MELNAAKVKEPRYAYLSLFGISSIDELKSLALANSGNSGATNDPAALANVRNGVKRFFDMAKDLEVPWLNVKLRTFQPVIEELLLKDMLICIDDVERRDKRLNLPALLGFLSKLKEEKSCRIVIICNTGELDSEDQKHLAKYREKVIDRQIQYSPEIKTNLGIIFSEADKEVADLFEKVNLNNIRVMQQVKWTLDYFNPLLVSARDSVKRSAMLQFAKNAIIYYGFAETLNVTELKNLNWAVELWRSEREQSPKNNEQLRILKDLQFDSSRWDELVVNYLEQGFASAVTVESVVREYNKSDSVEKAKQAFNDLWSLVYDNFQADAKAVKDRFLELCRSNMSDLDPWNMYTFSQVLDSFGIRYSRRTVVDFVRRRISEMSPAEAAAFTQDRKWPDDLAFRLRKRMENTTEALPIDELVRRLTATNGWNKRDLVSLDSYTEKQIFEWMSGSKSDGLLSALGELLRRAASPLSKVEGSELLDKLVAAIDKMGSRSPMDAFRVKRYVRGDKN